MEHRIVVTVRQVSNPNLREAVFADGTGLHYKDEGSRKGSGAHEVESDLDDSRAQSESECSSEAPGPSTLLHTAREHTTLAQHSISHCMQTHMHVCVKS